MKAKLLTQHFADMSTMTEDQKTKVRFAKMTDGKSTAIYAAGTEFEGEHALALCRNGQAAPSDQECIDALEMTPQQLESIQINYRMDSLGINKPEDRDLYRAGVIAGYGKGGAYLPGPNWQAYQDAKNQVENSEIDV
jgi:hypothetical protein